MHRRTVLAALMGVTGGCLETLTPAEAQPRVAERLAVERINDLRAAADVATLERDDTLVAAARAHARDMSVRGFYDHVNPDGERARDRVPCGAAETIHRGTLGPMETADDTTWYTRDPSDMAGYLVRDWQLSDPHNAILTERGFSRLGVGIYVGEDMDFFGVANFC
jgi:uncharacterized protein YkwD